MESSPDRKVNRNALRSAISDMLPDCPSDFIDLYLSLLESDPQSIVREAKLVLDKPYGKNNIIVDSGQYGLSFAQMNPGFGTSLHFHSVRKEFFCVHHGELTLISGDDVTCLKRYEYARSTPGIKHSLKNHGAFQLGILEIFSPALLNDKVRVQDPYQRTLGTVRFDQ